MAGVMVSGARRRPPATRTAPAVGEVLQANDGFLARVVELLSPHERMALRLRHRDGLAPRAIAARMHLPETIVRDLLESAEGTIRSAQRAFVEALLEGRAAATA